MTDTPHEDTPPTRPAREGPKTAPDGTDTPVTLEPAPEDEVENDAER